MIEASTGGDSDMVFQVMDCRNIEYEDESFNRVIDKGTLDTLLATEDCEKSVALYCAHVARILKPLGKFIIVSLYHPSNHLLLLENQDYSWKVTCTPLKKPVIGGEVENFDPDNQPESAHYLYVCEMESDDE